MKNIIFNNFLPGWMRKSHVNNKITKNGEIRCWTWKLKNIHLYTVLRHSNLLNWFKCKILGCIVWKTISRKGYFRYIANFVKKSQNLGIFYKLQSSLANSKLYNSNNSIEIGHFKYKTSFAIAVTVFQRICTDGFTSHS